MATELKCKTYTEGSVGAIVHKVLLKQEKLFDAHKARMDLTRIFKRPPTKLEEMIIRQHARDHGLQGVPTEAEIRG